MALNKRRITKKSIEISRQLKGKKNIILACVVCGNDVINLPPDVGTVTCDRCVQNLVAPPPTVQSKPIELRRPRGWQFRAEYRSPEGILYHRGEIVNETTSLSTTTTSNPRSNLRTKHGKRSTKSRKSRSTARK